MKRLILILAVVACCFSFPLEAAACGRRPVLRAAVAAPRAVLRVRPVRRVLVRAAKARPVRTVLFGR